MSRTRVYQFALRPPIQGEDLVRHQMLLAHRYRNDLVAVERARRCAVRAVYAADQRVAAAEQALRETLALPAAERAGPRLLALRSLGAVRKAAAEQGADELARIKTLDAELRRGARALCGCYWGTYLLIERAADAVRVSLPLWDKDALTPNDPRFVRASMTDRGDGLVCGDGHVAVQLQKGLPTAIVLDDSAPSRLVRVARAGSHWALHLRIDSDGRDPVWAIWPLRHSHAQNKRQALQRPIPDAALWKWVSVSVRSEGPYVERWSVEITVDDPAPAPRSLDRDLSGAIALTLDWTELPDGRMHVGSWVDSDGELGDVLLPQVDVQCLRKASAIRGHRDTLLNEVRPKFAHALRDCAPSTPWLAEAAATVALWKSPARFHALIQRWRRERCDDARPAYDVLQAWELRDLHLHDYEASSRGQVLRRRRERYRVLASGWAARYRTVVLNDQDLSREARRPDHDAQSSRQLCAVHELRSALRNVFGDDVAVGRADTPVALLEQWRASIHPERARAGSKPVEFKASRGGAWARRKRLKSETGSSADASREAGPNRAKE